MVYDSKEECIRNKGKRYYGSNCNYGHGNIKTVYGGCHTCRVLSKLVNFAKRRAINSNVPFDLDANWIRSEYSRGYCAVTGVPFRVNDEPWDLYSPSIDKKNSDTGYTKSNCRLVVWGYNALKSNKTDEHAQRLIHHMYLGINALRYNTELPLNKEYIYTDAIQTD